MKIRPRFQDKPAAIERNPRARPEEPLKVKTLAPPVRGLVLNENLSLMQPGAALVMDNWWPTDTGARLRGGKVKHATIDTDPVVSMWSYETASASKLFAATEDSIYDVTTPADPDVAPTADVTGQTGGYYGVQQFTTAGGDYLYAVNGADDALLYDGSTWTAIDGVSTPAITGVTTADLSHVWSFASRLFFVEKDTMVSWYLPVDSIGGAASSFSLAGVFKKGGSLLFGATWSLDAGDGLDDKCVFVSTEGEVAVYEGTNPGSASTWAKVGVYQITKPLGIKGTMQAGGDLLVATELGIVPLSEAIKKDPAALGIASVSRPISPAWKAEVAARPTLPWELIKWPSRSLMLTIMPSPNDAATAVLYVTNLETGAWARTTGWGAQCAATLGAEAYYGDRSGRIYQMDSSGADDGEPFTAIYVGGFDHFDNPEVHKTAMQARAVFSSNATFTYKMSMSADYRVSLPSAPNVASTGTAAEWGTAVWNAATWFSSDATQIAGDWVSIGVSGYALAPQVQITSGGSGILNVEMVSTAITYQTAQVVV